MKKKLLISLLICLATLGSFSLIRLYFVLTDGFTVKNISSDLLFNPEWETRPLSSEENKQLLSIFQQKFYYLGKGCQCYVLASEDDQHVIKFFKFKHLLQSHWLEKYPFPTFLKKSQSESNRRREAKLNLLFNGCKIAFENLQEETGTLFIHLNKTHSLNKQITIYDKMGISHQLNLDSFEFVVQKKAEMVHPTIEKLMSQGQTEKIDTIFFNLLNVLVLRSTKGVADHDRALIQNLGLLEGQAIILDSGQFVKDERIKNPDIYREDIKTRSIEFQQWLEAHHPSLLPQFNAAIKRL